MWEVNGVYTQALNRRHGRVGHVLQGRCMAVLVDNDSYLLELSRCICSTPCSTVVRDGDRLAVEQLSGRDGENGDAGHAGDHRDAVVVCRRLSRGATSARAFCCSGHRVSLPGNQQQLFLGDDDFAERMVARAKAHFV